VAEATKNRLGEVPDGQGRRCQIVREALVPEALPGLVSGFTMTLITLVGASVTAGAVAADAQASSARTSGPQGVPAKARLQSTQMIGLSIECSAWLIFFTQFVNPF
jgi:ABC-type methionine transport system permease subunit